MQVVCILVRNNLIHHKLLLRLCFLLLYFIITCFYIRNGRELFKELWWKLNRKRNGKAKAVVVTEGLAFLSATDDYGMGPCLSRLSPIPLHYMYFVLRYVTLHLKTLPEWSECFHTIKPCSLILIIIAITRAAFFWLLFSPLFNLLMNPFSSRASQLISSSSISVHRKRKNKQTNTSCARLDWLTVSLFFLLLLLV